MKTDAESQCMQLGLALEHFHNEYQTWPTGSNDLAGTGSKNPRKIVFYNGQFLNPWEKPVYYLADINEDGKLTSADGTMPEGVTVINATVAAWSEVPGESKSAANSWGL